MLLRNRLLSRGFTVQRAYAVQNLVAGVVCHADASRFVLSENHLAFVVMKRVSDAVINHVAVITAVPVVCSKKLFAGSEIGLVLVKDLLNGRKLGCYLGPLTMLTTVWIYYLHCGHVLQCKLLYIWYSHIALFRNFPDRCHVMFHVLLFHRCSSKRIRCICLLDVIANTTYLSKLCALKHTAFVTKDVSQWYLLHTLAFKCIPDYGRNSSHVIGVLSEPVHTTGKKAAIGFGEQICHNINVVVGNAQRYTQVLVSCQSIPHVSGCQVSSTVYWFVVNR